MAEKDIKKENLSKIAVKNSFYGFSAGLIVKLGGLVFTIIIARILLPELFGIYALALSIVAIFMTFTNLGVNETFLRYLSEALGKKDKNKARTYFKYLLKIKSLLVFLAIFVLLLLSKFLSYNFYNKPLLFYPLLFSCLFIIAESFKNFIGNIFLAKKDLRPIPFLELFHQITKILFSVLAILIFSTEFKVAGLFLAFALAGFAHLSLFSLISYKKDKSLFKGKTVSINKKRISKFLRFMGVASLSLVFFVSIDTLMLGKFVDAEYIAYYRVALSLILTIAALFSLSQIFLPIFTQIHKKRFERGFRKTFRYLMLITIPATAGVLFIGKYLIFTIYGKEYLLAVSVLYVLSFLIITMPLIGLYSIIFEAKEKPQIVSKSVLFSLVVNILLNVLVIFLFKSKPLFIIAGIGLATSLSRLLLLGLLIFYAKKEFNFKVKGIGLRDPIFATIIMSFFLFVFNHFINMNIFFGVIEVIFGIGIYFGILILTKSVNKEDFKLLKVIIKG